LYFFVGGVDVPPKEAQEESREQEAEGDHQAQKLLVPAKGHGENKDGDDGLEDDCFVRSIIPGVHCCELADEELHQLGLDFINEPKTHYIRYELKPELAEYDKYARSVKWQIIENFIIKENNIETKKEDVESYVREFIEKQWKLMKKDMNSEETNTFVNNVMQNKEEVEKIYNKLTDDKFRVLFKEKFKVTTKEISQEEFTKIITEHKH